MGFRAILNFRKFKVALNPLCRRQCFIGYPNTLNFVKNIPLRVVFSTLFLVFGYPDETLSLVFDILHNIRCPLRLLKRWRIYIPPAKSDFPKRNGICEQPSRQSRHTGHSIFLLNLDDLQEDHARRHVIRGKLHLSLELVSISTTFYTPFQSISRSVYQLHTTPLQFHFSTTAAQVPSIQQRFSEPTLPGLHFLVLLP